DGTIYNAYATGSVTGTDVVGGLVGDNEGPINNAYATGSITGNDLVGGLVGDNGGPINNAYATGSVTGNDFVGGLVGWHWHRIINNAYATGRVTGNDLVGGLVGFNTEIINNAYATGRVTGTDSVGGLVGDNSGTINSAYATGSVTGVNAVGGLVGRYWDGDWYYAQAITHSFWDIQTTGQSTSAGGVGLTTAQMKILANFNSATEANGNTNPGWDISANGGGNTVWRLYEGQSYPVLSSFQKNLTFTANDAGKTYDGVAYSGGNGVIQSTANDLSGTIRYGGSSQGATRPGRYAISPSVAMTQQDYQNWNVTFLDGVLTIDPVQPASGEIWLAGQARAPVPPSSTPPFADRPAAEASAGSGTPFLNLAPEFIRLGVCPQDEECPPGR
ncbi:MAG: hypothetical protein JNL84_06345, partial [Candidatus Accumulibacter sp.]|nr:hypothetical protein [Accumulibacter sp.]